MSPVGNLQITLAGALDNVNPEFASSDSKKLVIKDRKHFSSFPEFSNVMVALSKPGGYEVYRLDLNMPKSSKKPQAAASRMKILKSGMT